MFTPTLPVYVYNTARKWFLLACVAAFPITFFIDAPFGRFAPSYDSIFVFDGRKAWIVMELFSPLCLVIGFLRSPLSFSRPPLPPLASPQALLLALYFIHYANRAVISPLRSPSRSKFHFIVACSGISFNIVNGLLIGSYLSSPAARIYLGPSLGPYLRNTQSQMGLSLFILGFLGNIIHDEILLDIRRKARKGKAKDNDNNDHAGKGEYYGIPQGWLYSYISYPNYFCEWVEWIGFSLASSPLPAPLAIFFLSPSLPGLLSLVASLPFELYGATIQSFNTPAAYFAPTLTPPWLMAINAIIVMLPRAVRGHRWYLERFGDAYPKDRRAVVPFLL